MESRLRMAVPIQPQHDLSPIEIDEVEEWIYNYNRRAIGRNDARGLGFVIRDEAGRTIGVASYDFQAPGMYEKAGFKRVAEFAGWPEGHSNVVHCKTLIARSETP